MSDHRSVLQFGYVCHRPVCLTFSPSRRYGSTLLFPGSMPIDTHSCAPRKDGYDHVSVILMTGLGVCALRSMPRSCNVRRHTSLAWAAAV